ncbi:MAG TPA: hypothetical protein PKD00_00080 [Burkholderiales bacterium]|nr:hypothetical protein [Burkholderiales bacterium]
MAKRTHCDIIIAWANDDTIEIEVKYNKTGQWCNIQCPSWLPLNEYRIKKKPVYRPFTYEELCSKIGMIVESISGMGNGQGIIVAVSELNSNEPFAQIGCGQHLSAEKLLKRYKFKETGLPCGVKI